MCIPSSTPQSASALYRFCPRTCPVKFWAGPFSPQNIAPSRVGIWTHIWFHGPRVHIPNCISIGSAVFTQLTGHSPYTLQRASTFLPQNCPLHWSIWTPIQTWFLGPCTRVTIPEQHHDRSSHYRDHGRDRQTDRPRCSVCSNRPHLADADIRPNDTLFRNVFLPDY